MGMSCLGQGEGRSCQKEDTSFDFSVSDRAIEGIIDRLRGVSNCRLPIEGTPGTSIVNLQSSIASEGDEGIQTSLLVDCRAGAMSADDGHGAKKGDEFPADRGEDGLGVASPQIGPADRAAEESVAGEEDRLGPFEQEAGGTWRVSRCVDRAQ